MSPISHKRTPRFLLPEAHTQGQRLPLNGDQLHHACRVLRLRNGQPLRAWNGDGLEFQAILHTQDNTHAWVVLDGAAQPLEHAELRRSIGVLQALPESDKMDWVLEKCTELGASSFYPVQAQRSVVRLDANRLSKRHAHWERVVVSASLQSERGRLAVIHPCTPLEEQLARLKTKHPDVQLLWFSPEAKLTLIEWLQQSPGLAPSNPNAPWVICVGPEGGWTPQERELAEKEGAVALQFAPRVLRTETFAMACIAQLTGLLKLDPPLR